MTPGKEPITRSATELALVLGLLASGASLVIAVPPASPTAEAERLASEAVGFASTRPQDAVTQARKALALTADFEPTAFVKAGRKGEVVEDAYLAAREEYRRHRAQLYESLGLCLAAGGQHLPASRYLRRAFLLEPAAPSILALARSLVAIDRGPAALEALEKAALFGGRLAPEGAALLEQVVDAAGLPSAQVEVDRVRLTAITSGPVEFRDGPFALPAGARLSTTPVFRLEETPVTVFYRAEASCRSCSEDLQTLKRVVPADVRIITVPESPEQDQALRQVLGLYRYPWPLLLVRDAPKILKLEPRDVLVVGRSTWAGAVVKVPFAQSLPAVLDVFLKTDIREAVPRPAWNHRPAARPRMPPAPGLLPEGLAPGEEEPAPAEFTAAVEAYRAGRAAEALRLIEGLEAKGDGWLLPPEARLNRGLCLAKIGRREEARRLLLRTGDSRLQDAVDRALEEVGTPARR
jgi:tetratricopeptide (TPR) repeat protein